MGGTTIGSGDELSKTAERRKGADRPERLPLFLNASADVYRNTKATLERIHGHSLTHDETINLAFGQYLDLPAEWTIVQEVQRRLNELKEHLEKNREPQAATLVEIFRDALTDVFQGHVSVPGLTNALLEAE